MPGKDWGVFLCDCRSTLAVSPGLFEGQASLITVASEPEQSIGPFAAQADERELERVVVACCSPRSLFREALGGRELVFLDLKEKCFTAHSDPAQAQAKARRMIHAAMMGAEARGEISQNLMRVGGRLALYTDSPTGLKLAEKVRELGEMTVFVAPGAPGFEGVPAWKVNRARLVSVEGRLGNFQVTTETPANGGSGSPEPVKMAADQVVVWTEGELPPIQRRTGVHLYHGAGEEVLEEAVERVRELSGVFRKPEHVAYDPQVCAGGAATLQACGHCITSCPYDAIARDSTNPLRIRVDHLACEGCGACVSTCPTSALRFTEPSPKQIYAQLAGLLAEPVEDGGAPPVILFHCEEQGRRLLQEAGAAGLHYPASVLPVEVPCLRYVSEAIMLEAVRMGAAGVGLLGCETCPNGERELLLGKMELSRQILDSFGLGGDRLRLITTEPGNDAEAVAALTQFASAIEGLPAAGEAGLAAQLPRQTGNREILAEAIGGLIELTGREPGGIKPPAGQPFGFAEVREAGCTMCRACTNVCPTHAFKFEEETLTLHFKPINCISCGLCENFCPEKVISVRSELFLEKQALEYSVVVRDEMLTCISCEKPFINRRALEAVEARVLNLATLLDTFDGDRKKLLRMCPDCRAAYAILEVDKGWEP